jgi:hypothetical protein
MPTSSSSVRAMAAHIDTFTRWMAPSRPTIAMPIGASSKAERKRTSLSRIDSRASSFMRQETMLTTPSPLMNSACTAAQRQGCDCAETWS